MAAMMVSAGPAKANETNFESGINAVQIGDTLIASGDDDFDFGDNDIDGVLFAFDDIDDDVFGEDDVEDFGIDNEAFLFCDPCNFDEFDPAGIDIG